MADKVFLHRAWAADGLLVALDPVGKAVGNIVGSTAGSWGASQAEIGLSGVSGEPDTDLAAIGPVCAPVPGELPSIDSKGAEVVLVGVLVVWVPWVVEYELEVSVLLSVGENGAL